MKDDKNFASLGAAWAILCVTILFVSAIVRLAPRSLEALRSGLSFTELTILIVWCVYMLVTEGYMGFQRRLSPRFASRMLYLYKHPDVRRLLLAPLFCMGYIGSTMKRKKVIWIF